MKKPMSASLKKIFAGKETPKEEAREKRVAKKMAPKAPKKKYEELERKYEPGVHKDKKGYAKGGMALGGPADPRRSLGRGPGIAAMMGDGSRRAIPGIPSNPRSMMAKGGGVESKGKTQGKSVSMKKKYV